MDDSRKIFSGNFENGTSILPPRITSSRSRGYVAPCRRKQSFTEGGDEEERVTNQRKQRYWNSYEEMYLVELWRRYKDEVTEFNKPLPVHRKIMVSMRTKDMMVTGQDCRRKINTLNNRYKTEVQRMKLSGVKPDWRLFSMIHCIMEPKMKEFDVWHETKIVKKLLEQIPKPPELTSPTPPAAAVTTPVVPTTTTRQPIMQHRGAAHLNANARGPLITSIPLQSIPTKAKILPTTFFTDNINNSSLPLTPAPFTHPPPLAATPLLTGTKSNLPFRDITLKKYEQIQLNNEILTQQRNTALKRLRLEEEGLKAFETILIDWTEQTREVIKTIERLATASSSLSSSTDIKQQQIVSESNNGHVAEQTLSVN